ncbi:ribonuclease T(2) [Altererythrobacter sp. MTPC7]
MLSANSGPLLALAGLVVVGLPAAASAQAYQCKVPARISVPQAKQDGPVRQVPVTGYTMALSWSPEFCRTRQRSGTHATQCSGRNGRFGFIVHGLWPDGRSTWPQYCPTARRPQPATVAKNLCMMPSASLAARQWAKHGSCMTRRPDTYFNVTRILWNSYRWPDFDRISREEGLTAGRIREAFASANPGWEPSMVGVKLNRRGWLQELRLCYGKRFRPKVCPSRTFGPKDGVKAKIWRGM